MNAPNAGAEAHNRLKQPHLHTGRPSTDCVSPTAPDAISIAASPDTEATDLSVHSGLAYLLERGLTECDIPAFRRQVGIIFTDEVEAEALLNGKGLSSVTKQPFGAEGNAAKRNGPAIVYTYLDPFTKEPWPYAMSRILDAAGTDGDPKAKAPRGKPNRLWFNPLCDWTNIPQGATVVLCESILKALMAFLCGYKYTIAYNGVRGGVAKNKPIPDFRRLPWKAKGLHLTILTDSDYRINPDVRNAAEALAKALHRETGVVANLAQLPAPPESYLDGYDWGADDAAHHLGRDYLKGIVDAAHPTGPFFPELPPDGNVIDVDLGEHACTVQEMEDATDAPDKEIVATLIPGGGVSAVFGSGAATKTLFMQRLAVHVALGTQLLNQFNVNHPGAVIYVSREDSRKKFLKRLGLICRGLALTVKEKQAVTERVHLYPANARLTRDERGTTKLTNFTSKLAGAARRCATPVSMIVIDSLSLYASVEESNEGSALVMDALNQVAAFLDCAVVLVHHISKAAARGKVDDAYAARGAGALTENSRGVLILQPWGATDDLGKVPPEVAARIGTGIPVFLLVQAKRNYGGKREGPWWLELPDYPIHKIVTTLGPAKVSNRASLQGREREVLRALIAVGGKANASGAGSVSAIILRDVLGTRRDTKKQILPFVQALVNQGFLNLRGRAGARTGDKILEYVVTAAGRTEAGREDKF